MSMTLYNKILMNCFTNLFVPRDCLVALNPSIRYSERTIKDALERKHLKETYLLSTRGSQKSTVRLMSITPAGINYLVCKSDISDWISAIEPSMTKRACVLHREDYVASRIKRMALISEANVLAVAAGAVSPLLIHRNDDMSDVLPQAQPVKHISDMSDTNLLSNSKIKTKVIRDEHELDYPPQNDLAIQTGLSYMEIIERAIGPDKTIAFQNMCNPLEDGKREIIRFTDIRRVRAIAAGEKNLISKGGDYERCKTNGILDSKYKSVLLYGSHEVGISWNKWQIDKDVQLLLWWIVNRGYFKYGHKSYLPPQYGLLFVKNSRHFSLLFNDRAKRLIVKDTYLGQGLDKLYIVPKTYEGIQYLRAIMTCDDDDLTEKVIETMVSKDFSRNEKGNTKLWPLTSNTGMKVAVGVQMDAVQMQFISEEINNSKGQSYFGVICLPWQKPYYEAAIPELKIISL